MTAEPSAFFQLVQHLDQAHYQGTPLLVGTAEADFRTVLVDGNWYRELRNLTRACDPEPPHPGHECGTPSASCDSVCVDYHNWLDRQPKEGLVLDGAITPTQERVPICTQCGHASYSVWHHEHCKAGTKYLKHLASCAGTAFCNTLNRVSNHDTTREIRDAAETWVSAELTAVRGGGKMEAALRSIAANTCCEGCRQAALVAKQALNPDTNPAEPPAL